jgi:cell division protein FtsN
MTELSTNIPAELAHGSSDGLDVTLIYVQDGGEESRSSASATHERARTSRSRPSRTPPSTSTSTRSPTETSAPSIRTTAAVRRSPMVEVGAYPTRSDAELAQTALTAAGVPSVVAADDSHLRQRRRPAINLSQACTSGARMARRRASAVRPRRV